MCTPDNVGEAMKVEIKLFGNLGHYLPDGGNRFSFQQLLNEGATIQDMLNLLKLPEDIAIIAIVNGMQVGKDHILKDRDEVNVFRPSGGD
jgi:sulfur carrier protein ThiS